MVEVKAVPVFDKRQDIEPDREVEMTATDISIGSCRKETDFTVVHGVFRPSIVERRSGLDLHDDQHIAFLSDDIDFFLFPPPVCLANDIALRRQIFPGVFLAPYSQCIPIRQ